MTAKEYLYQIRDYEERIRETRDTLARTESALRSIRARDYTRDRVQASRDNGDAMAESLDRIAAARDRIASLLAEQVELRERVLSQLDGMPEGTHRDFLYRRYVEYKRLDRIADEMFYSPTYIRQLHMAALQAFADQYPESLGM